ncbi:type II toxin-antitoxin system prevent-host-death family antitoxin [Pseudoxanthomonas sp.]|jgi:hypothetical protein|uniref:type II toxin-antitoxin system prevent-host-death family antitoxin n=1 Tax=Pseudoxanthomonas sp. TaxID=1871049 RepID=UPI002E14E7AE|nr:type II toxin-antitoxin system prevent-host-death family antitoxin [Pseudoxanthomonas sp.]
MNDQLATESELQAADLLAEIERERESLQTARLGSSSPRSADSEACAPSVARMEMLEGLMRGERAISEGRAVCHWQARELLVRWLGKVAAG